MLRMHALTVHQKAYIYSYLNVDCEYWILSYLHDVVVVLSDVFFTLSPSHSVSLPSLSEGLSPFIQLCWPLHPSLWLLPVYLWRWQTLASHRGETKRQRPSLGLRETTEKRSDSRDGKEEEEIWTFEWRGNSGQKDCADAASAGGFGYDYLAKWVVVFLHSQRTRVHQLPLWKVLL